jgi:hypothetical protein
MLRNLLILNASVMRLIKSWLTNHNVIIANDVLVEMQIFADAVDGSNALKELALEVLQCIPEKVRCLLVNVDKAPFSTTSSQASQNFPFSSITSSSDLRPDRKPTPRQLAVALAALERERYLRILAAEYIAEACKLTSYSPNLQEALALNKRITNWVMSSILQREDRKGRTDVKIFFVDTAKVNFNLFVASYVHEH